MRTFTLIALAAAAIGAPAYAQQAAATQDDTMVRIQGVQPRYKMDVKEFADYSGRYILSDGQRMTLSNQKKRYFAQIDGRPSMEIVPVGYNEFVAKGTGMRLRFSEFHGNRSNDLVISEPALVADMRLGAR
jgi:hypothetical protein